LTGGIAAAPRRGEEVPVRPADPSVERDLVVPVDRPGQHLDLGADWHRHEDAGLEPRRGAQVERSRRRHGVARSLRGARRRHQVEPAEQHERGHQDCGRPRNPARPRVGAG
jgi:hypothetical protein